MLHDPSALLVPRVLVVDDERQIHASLRLRLARDYDLVCCLDPRQALGSVENERFDLCFVDLHMPHLDGFAFIERARQLDADLGYVVLSAFDSDDNLRRSIPLGVYDFVSKPLPEREGFEARIPDWINRTRGRRRNNTLAAQAGNLASDLDCAKLEREVELVASENARDALRQTASLLTTVHAHLVSATTLLGGRTRADPAAAHLWRNLEEARKTAEAAITAAEGFFDSAYGSRDESPAMVNEGVRDAIGIATRMSGADTRNTTADFASLSAPLPIRGLSGIDFLLMMVPALGAALVCAAANTTVGVFGEQLPRLDTIAKDPRLRSYLWINRRNALLSQPGIALTIAATAPALSRSQVEAWLKSEYAPLATITARGLAAGLQKCQGLLGISVSPQTSQFRLVLALPT